MTILCIDTSEATTVAVVSNGKVLASTSNESARHHAENIAPLVDAALEQAGLPTPVARAGLSAVVVGTGPAPFTGLRAGLISGRVIAEVAGVPVYGVSSLDMIARQALDVLPPEAEVIVVSDARRKEIYWARYRANGPDDVQRVGGPDVGYATDMVAGLGQSAGLCLVASGDLPVHSSEVLSVIPRGPKLELNPGVAARIAAARVARQVSGDEATVELGTEPLYLRRPEIHGQPVERM